MHNPPVVFFDEPLDGLDANAVVGFKTLIQTLEREGKTIVYSSHIGWMQWLLAGEVATVLLVH